MPSIFSDQMRDQILDEFKGVEVPRLSQSIINRFGQNPRNEGVGQLSRSQGFLIGENDPTSQRPGPIWDFPNDFPVPNENPDRPRRVPSPPRQNPLQPPEPPPYEGPLPSGIKPPVQVAPEGSESNRLGELYEQLKLRIPSRTSSGGQERAPKMQRTPNRVLPPRGMNRGGGLGALEAEQYRAMVDAPLQNSPVMASNGWRRMGDWLNKYIDFNPYDDRYARYKRFDSTSDTPNIGTESELSQEEIDLDLDLDLDKDLENKESGVETKGQQAKLAFDDVVGLVAALASIGSAGKGTTAPTKAPRWRAPKTSEIKGVGGIGMNDGGTVLNRRLFLGGGEVDGIGGERDDLVPIWASDREYVVSANGVRRMGGGNHARGIEALDKVNNNGRLV